MLRLIFRSLICAVFFTASPAFAFAPHDQATVSLSLDSSWTTIADVLQDDPSTVKYQKITPVSPEELKKIQAQPKPSGRNAPPPPATEYIQTISQRLQAKPIHVETADFINQMAQILASGLKSKGCQVGTPFPEQQTGDRFHIWAQVFQCQKVQLTGIQYYIDADPKNIYLITYTNTQYPFTSASRLAAETLVKGALKICYQDQCYTVQ